MNSRIIIRIATVIATPVVFLLSSTLLARQAQQSGDRPALEHRGENSVVLSRQRLDPPLRSGNRRVRFSPDGKYILLQDDSGVRVFTHDPLEQKFYIAATRILPAAFSADSQNLVISGANLEVATVSLVGTGDADAKPVNSSVKGCIAASLSPVGNAVSCLDHEFKLHLLRIPDGHEIVSSQLLTLPAGMYKLERIPSGTAFSEPFGYVITNAPGLMFTKNASTGNLLFSPDGRYLMCRGFDAELEAFDTTNGQKFNLPGSLRHRSALNLHFSGTDEVAVLDPKKPDDSVLLSFPDGKTLKKIALSGRAWDTSAENYLVYSSADATDAGIFDLRNGNSVVKLSDNPAADVYGRDVATYTPNGDLVLSHLLDSTTRTIHAGAGLLPTLQVVAVTPNLDSLALSVGGEGAVFSVADGKQITKFQNLRGGWCDASTSCYLGVGGHNIDDFELKRVSGSSSEAATIWARNDSENKHHLDSAHHTEYFPSASVWFQHSMDVDPELFLDAGLRNHGSSLASMRIAGFALQALDTRTGNELWKRDFEKEAPVPFSDPQGDRFVLGWRADSSGGRRAMKENPAATEAFKHDKQADRDSYFEAVDAQTGKTSGGVLAQIDSPPEEFDSAFSEGDWLVLAKDGQRVFVFSISSGQQILKLFGWRPTINAATTTLCLSTLTNRLTTYDLKTGEKLRNYDFKSGVAFAHFSPDGQRLLVLTEDQLVYVLDMRR